MNKKTVLTIVGIACVCIIGFGIYLFSMPKTLETPSSNNKTNDSQTSAPVEPYKEKKPPVSDEKKLVEEEFSKIGSIDETKQESIEGFSNKDIKEATEFISTYTRDTHTNRYFLGGDWVKSGAKIDELKSFLSSYYSKNIIDDLDKFKGKEKTTEFSEKAMTLVPFFGEAPNYNSSSYCSDMDEELSSEEKTEEMNCVNDFNISEIRFDSLKEKEGYDLRAEFTVKSKLALFSKELNKEAFVDLDYKYELRLTPTAVGGGNSNWEITGYKIYPHLSKIQEQK